MEAVTFLTFDNVSVRLGGRRVLNDIHWRVAQGQNWAVWGANGAGKTTLAKTLLGEAAVVGGFVRRNYSEDPHCSNGRPAVALISSEQYHRFHERERMLTEMRGFSGRGEETRARELLATERDMAYEERRRWIQNLLGLGSILTKPLSALSSGEMRKLLLGRALLAHPRMLVLDEPFNGLDTNSRASLRQALENLSADDTQIVLITHRLSEIPDSCTHVLHLDQGRVIWQGRRDGFMRHLARRAEKVPPPVADPTGLKDAADPPESGTPLVCMRNVTVRFGRTLVIDGIDWTVSAGEHWALIGPNGAGKSTLLKLITGEQLQGYANDIELFGRPKGSGETLQEIRDAIGHMDDVLQARYQHDMNGLDVVCSGFFDSVGLYRRCTPEQIQVAQGWMRRLDLEYLAVPRFARLSFGEQRLLLLVRAMVKSPRLLILDEPCNGLDSRHRQRMLGLLDLIGSDGRTTLIYTSHRPDELPACITHRLYLENGRVVRTAIQQRSRPTADTVA